MHIDFEKEVQKRKLHKEKEISQAKVEALPRGKQHASLPKQEKKENSSKLNTQHGQSLLANNLGGLNLFDIKTFQTEENFDHLKVVPVVDDDEIRRQELSLKIKEYDKYTHDNPFHGTLKDFLEGPALEAVEDYADESKDADLKGLLAVESDILVKINNFDCLSASRKSITVKRTSELNEVRQKLPAALKEYEILESVIGSLVTIICGETGSGKSTQTPQFLYEAGLSGVGMIGVTQPRRLAAISLAQRVSEELCAPLGEKVGYQVRFEASKFSESTKIKFMTDGILLNEMMTDFLLTSYSVVVIDEAHERKVNTDLLLGLLSRVVRIRAKLALKERENYALMHPGAGAPAQGYTYHPLRLVIMSATLRVTDFTENKYLFPDSKINIVNIESRMFPVKTIFDKETNQEYVEACLEKTLKIHTKLPPGAILVFLTGEEEIKYFCSQLKTRLLDMQFERERNFYEIEEEELAPEAYDLQEEENGADAMKTEPTKVSGSKAKDKSKETKKGVDIADYLICPLYTKLPLPEQQKIFHHGNSKKRLIVVSTNVAETSLTIPGVKYVVDSGKEKKKVYSADMALGRFEIDWVSQSSAKQREGRAGRTCAGFCYRVYSQAVYSKMPEFSPPEIQREPLASSVLSLKAIGIQDIYRFPFVTKPPGASLVAAETELTSLGALTSQGSATPLGLTLAQLPLAPRPAKLILLSKQAEILPLGILLATALSTEQLLDTRDLKQELANLDASELTEKESKRLKRELLSNYKNKYAKMASDKSDILTEANILGWFIKHMMESGDAGSLNDKILAYSKSQGLVFKSVREAYSLILHLLSIAEMIVPQEKELNKLREGFRLFGQGGKEYDSRATEVLLACHSDKVGRRVKFRDEEGREKEAFETIGYSSLSTVHPSSFVFGQRPQYLLYHEVIEHNDKIFLSRVTEIEDPGLLAKYDNTETRKVVPLPDRQPIYVGAKDKMMQFVTGTFGPKLWELGMYLTDCKPGRDRNVHFLYCLLQGKVFPGFSVLKDRLVLKIADSMPVEPKGLQQAINLFVSKDIHSKETFLREDKLRHKELLGAIASCVQEKYKEKLDRLWDKLKGQHN